MKKLAFILSFVGLVSSQVTADVLFNEPFNYPDGPLITVSSGGPNVWTNNSGTLYQMDVASGVVNLTENESEDAASGIAGGPYATGYLYYSMLVNFSAVPFGTAGGYFAHLGPTGTFYRARLFAAPSATGGVTLGISNGGNTPTLLGTSDLSLGTTHRAVVRYDAGNALATLWLDPTTEGDPSVTGTDSGITAEQIVRICLRQSKTSTVGMGTLTVDDVLVGTTFADVVPVPEPTGLLSLGLLGLAGARLLRRRS